MFDLAPLSVDDPGGTGGSEDGPAPDNAILVSHSGGDGGSQGVGTDRDPGGDGGSEQGPTPDDPRLALTMGGADHPGGDGSTEEAPCEDPPPGGTLHEITAG